MNSDGARVQSKLLPNAKAVSNHLLIDPAAAVFERTDEAYQPLRRELVSTSLHHFCQTTAVLVVLLMNP